MNPAIGPIELLTIKTNNRLLKTKDYYFHISNTGVRDFVTAYSFVDAKARAWRMYPDDQERIVWEDNTDPVPDTPTARLFF